MPSGSTIALAALFSGTSADTMLTSGPIRSWRLVFRADFDYSSSPRPGRAAAQHERISCARPTPCGLLENENMADRRGYQGRRGPGSPSWVNNSTVKSSTEDDFYGEKLIARVGLGKEPHRRGWHIMVRYGQKSKRSPVFGSPENNVKGGSAAAMQRLVPGWRARHRTNSWPESEKGRMTLDALWRFHFLKDIDRILPNKQTQKNYHSRLKRILPALGRSDCGFDA